MFVLLADNLDVKDASLIIDENTKIVFSIPNDKLFISEDVLSDTDISELPKKIHTMSEFSKYKAYTFYIQKFTIKNSLSEDKILSISQGENHFKSEFLLKFKDRDESFVNSAVIILMIYQPLILIRIVLKKQILGILLLL